MAIANQSRSHELANFYPTGSDLTNPNRQKVSQGSSSNKSDIRAGGVSAPKMASELQQRLIDDQKWLEEKYSVLSIDKAQKSIPKDKIKSFHRRTMSFSPSNMKKSFLQNELCVADPNVQACKIGVLRSVTSLFKPTNKFESAFREDPRIFDKILAEYELNGKAKFPDYGMEHTPYYKVIFCV
jgi:hypothetical protein